MFKVNKILGLILILSVLLIVIPSSFAGENDTVMAMDGIDENPIGISDSDVLKASTDYYFNASAETDGNGSINNPYKYLTQQRIKDNCNIYLADGEYDLDKTATIQQVTFIGTSPDKTILNYNGVAFSVSNSLTLSNITINGATIVNYGKLNATNTVFSHGVGYYMHDSYGNNFGGAIKCPQSSGSTTEVTVNNCTFSDNYAEYGGAIYMYEGSLDIIDTVFKNNLAYNFGGSIACEWGTKVSISKSKFYNSSSMSDAGGAIYLRSSSLTINDVEIDNSSATFGGAITSLNTNVTLSNLKISNSSAKWDGGAIYHMYGSFSSIYGNFFNNSAKNGGALFIDNSTNLLLKNNTFNGNDASYCAGAIYSLCNTLNSASSVRQFNTFMDNSAIFRNDEYEQSSVDLNIANGNYTMYKHDDEIIDELPSYYSLRDDGLVTIPKDQQTSGNCWAFTAIAVLESAILKASGQSLDFSEENMKNVIAKFSDYGWDISTNDGGYDYMPWGYLASWLGPVLESDDAFDDNGALSPVLDSVMHVQNILFLKRDNYLDNDDIKRAILKYGAVGTSMLYDDDYFKGNGYYCWSNSYSNHAVTIVGWDDDYSASNFFGIGQDGGDGAWIVQNSWGPNWKDNGYFYVSYYDVKFAQPGVDASAYAIILNDTINYDKNYQYDIAGITDFFYTASSELWYKNIFQSESDEFIAGVSTYFEKITDWTASIFVNGVLQLTKQGTSNPGYYTIDLGRLIPLKAGDEFEVQFRVNNSDVASIPISEKISLNKEIYKPGISFISLDGKNWEDFYNKAGRYLTHTYYSQVASIKAFTIKNIINTTLTLTVNDDLSIIAKVLDQYGNILNNGNVTFTVNGFEYLSNLTGFGAVLTNPNLNQTSNTIAAVFSQIGYNSSSNIITVEIPKTAIDLSVKISQYSNNASIYLESSSNINTSLMVKINNKNYLVKFDNGKAYINFTNLENDLYAVEVICENSSAYQFDDITESFKIDVKHTKILVNDLITFEGSGALLNITLLDENDEILSDKELIVNLNNMTLVKRTNLNGIISVPVNLTYGNYSADIVFAGDNDYFASNQSAKVKVKINVAIDVDVNRSLNNVIVNVSLSKQVNESLTVVVNGKSYAVSSVDGKAFVELFNLSNEVYNVSVRLDDSDNYEFNETNSSFVIDVKETHFISGDLLVCDDDAFNFNVTLVDENDVMLSNKSVIFTLDDEIFKVVTDDNGVASISLDLANGKYNISVNFEGDNDFFASKNQNAIKIITNVDLDISPDINQNNVVLNIGLSKLLNTSLTVVVNDKSYQVNSINGSASVELFNLSNGVYNVSVALDNDDIYNSSSLNSSFNIDVKSTRIISEDLITLEDSGVFNISLVDENNNLLANRELVIVLNNLTLVKITDFNGSVSIPLDLTKGNYTVDVIFEGDNNYFSSDKSNNIIVKAKVAMDYAVRSFDKTAFDVNLSKTIDGTLNVTVDDKSYLLDIHGKTVSLILSDLDAGLHTLEISILESDIYEFDNISAQFKVDVKRTEILADDIWTYYLSQKAYVTTLIDEYGNPISGKDIKVKLADNIFSVKTDKNGHASFNINLKEGDYDAELSFEGDSNYSNSSKSSKVHVKSTIIMNDTLTKTYGSQISFKLLDVDGNPLKNADVIFTMDNVNQTGISDGNGIVSVKITKQYGNCDLTIYNPVNDEQLFISIDVVKRIAQNKDIAVYEFSNSPYRVLVLDDNGNPEVAGKVVTFNLAGKTYTAKTDANGYASLKISLAKKTYTVTASYKGFKVSNKITVKSVLTAKNISKKKAKSYTFQAKLVNKNGKALKGKKLIFKIKGKKYTAKTNKNGIAKITIKLSLKVGSYKIYTSYGKSKITNTLKIKK